MKIIGRLLAILLLLIASCNRPVLSQSDYKQYVENDRNGLLRRITVDVWEYKIQYKPYDYIILQEQTPINIDYYKKRMGELKGTAWFTISFKRKDSNISPLRLSAGNITEYQQLYDYFLYEAGRSIELIYNNKKYSPMSYLFVTTYSLTPEETMVVGFDLKEESAPKNKMQIIYNDILFGNGIIKATYSSDLLTQIPLLNINQK